MQSKRYYEYLLDSLPDDPGVVVARLVRGVAWTAAMLSDGRCGVGMHTEGESVPRRFETLLGLPARKAAEALLSWNFEEASEGQAVVNAVFNTEANAAALGCRYTESALAGLDLKGRTIGFVGHLVKHNSITPELLRPAKAWYILEREPKQGDYPDSACEYILPDCDLVVITGSAAINKTLPRLLELSRGAEVVLTGPSVPLCPGLAEEFHLRRLNTQVIVDPEGMAEAIVAQRRSINAFSRHFTLDTAPC